MRTDDIVQIISVVNLYPLAVDTRRWDLFDQVFTPDAQADFGGGARWMDLASLKRDFALVHEPFSATQHVTTNHQVAGDEREARCISYVQGRFIREVPGGNMFESHGWYDDALIRTADGWRIRSRTCKAVWAGGNPKVLQTMDGVTGEQQFDSLSREAAAGRLGFLQALGRPS
jgi:SnoaL-like domain